MHGFPLYNIQVNNNNKSISDQSTRIKMTQENGGNKTSHTNTTTRTAAPGKKKCTHMHPSKTQNTENKFHNIILPEFPIKGYFYN
jgi:hypothetical protein